MAKFATINNKAAKMINSNAVEQLTTMAESLGLSVRRNGAGKVDESGTKLNISFELRMPTDGAAAKEFAVAPTGKSQKAKGPAKPKANARLDGLGIDIKPEHKALWKHVDVSNKDAVAFAQNASKHEGMKLQSFGKQVKVDNDYYIITGVSNKMSDKPVTAENGDGKKIKITVPQANKARLAYTHSK